MQSPPGREYHTERIYWIQSISGEHDRQTTTNTLHRRRHITLETLLKCQWYSQTCRQFHQVNWTRFHWLHLQAHKDFVWVYQWRSMKNFGERHSTIQRSATDVVDLRTVRDYTNLCGLTLRCQLHTHGISFLKTKEIPYHQVPAHRGVLPVIGVLIWKSQKMI